MRKKLLFILTCFLFSYLLRSQIVFLPPGAEWHHTFTHLGVPPYLGTVYNNTSKYIKDSIIGTDTLKVLQHGRFHKECSGGNPLTFIKQKGDTVFMKNSITQNTWQILYNFAALPGHNWTNTFLNGDNSIRTYTITVDTVKFINVNSFTLKQLVVKYKFSVNANIVSENAKITERFGCDQFLFNYHNETYGFCDIDFFSGFLCYQDSAFGLKQFTNKPCDYNVQVGLNENVNELLNFNLSPNPANTQLNIDFITDSKNYKVVILNNLGQIVSEKEINSGNKTTAINIEMLANGSYLIKLINADQNDSRSYKRFIIAR